MCASSRPSFHIFLTPDPYYDNNNNYDDDNNNIILVFTVQQTPTPFNPPYFPSFHSFGFFFFFFFNTHFNRAISTANLSRSTVYYIPSEIHPHTSTSPILRFRKLSSSVVVSLNVDDLNPNPLIICQTHPQSVNKFIRFLFAAMIDECVRGRCKYWAELVEMRK